MTDPFAPLDHALESALELPIPATQRASVRAVHGMWSDAVRAVAKSAGVADLTDHADDAALLFDAAAQLAREGATRVAAAGRVRA